MDRIFSHTLLLDYYVNEILYINHDSYYICNMIAMNICTICCRYLCMPENQDPQFLLEYRGPVSMKGKSEPMNVWFLSRERELTS